MPTLISSYLQKQIGNDPRRSRKTRLEWVEIGFVCGYLRRPMDRGASAPTSSRTPRKAAIPDPRPSFSHEPKARGTEKTPSREWNVGGVFMPADRSYPSRPEAARQFLRHTPPGGEGVAVRSAPFFSALVTTPEILFQKKPLRPEGITPNPRTPRP